jgi:putative flavoprotein involved in K+ transport
MERDMRSDINETQAQLVEPGAAFATLENKESFAGKDPASPRAAGGKKEIDVIVVGAGQAGLSTGYHLRRLGLEYLILEANERIGDVWRDRWDSLRLFTPAKFDGLDGMPFPAPPDFFPTKDEMADYLEAYAAKFEMPLVTGAPVETLRRENDRYVVRTGKGEFRARHVVIAAASYQRPRIPDFAKDLDPGINQMHSSEYRNPKQMTKGGVLLVGAGNSGAELAMDLIGNHKVWLSGRDVGNIPFRVSSFLGRKLLIRLVVRGLFHQILTVHTPIGRKFRPTFLSQGGPLIRTRRKNLDRAGVLRVPRVSGVRNGKPYLADGTVPDVANVIWCTGYSPGLSWIKLPIFDAAERPFHDCGIVPGEPGLYFVGVHFQRSVSSTMIHGVGRDARHIARCIRERVDVGT